ncbi:MAG: serine/threonine-protein kinase [Leptolyngbyaceae cyanobacterium bins.59]|nr:serine/threonine-protein kinase [Leptolyngbyaceae cyanobacterium bins.59]
MLTPGHVLHDRYHLQKKLGHNAGRQTWLAEDTQVSPSELVIVKLLTFGGDVQWENLKLFEREAQTLKELTHPRIPCYRDYFSIDDHSLWFGMVQNYIPGRSLKELLAQGEGFSEEVAQQIAIDVLEILIYLHARLVPVLHRDIKPSNLIAGEDGQIYLVDFGAVQSQGVAEGATITIVGTYGYAPVEQFGGRTVPASDLYALGTTLLHLLTGIPPSELPQRDLRISIPESLNLSLSFASWLNKITEPSLERRFTSAAEALEALKSGEIIESGRLGLITPTIPNNNSGQGKLFDRSIPVPKEIRGWNWGAFLLAPYWSLTHRVWFGVLVWLLSNSTWWIVRFTAASNPFLFKAILLISFLLEVGLMATLGRWGNAWAWKGTYWRDIQQFKKHQQGWTIAAVMIGIPLLLWALMSRWWFFWLWLR